MMSGGMDHHGAASPLRTPRIEAMKHSQDCARRWWKGVIPLMVFPCLVPVLAHDYRPRWAVMWLLAFAIFCGCKWMTWRGARIAGASLRRNLGYLLAWPGLDADGFLNPDPRAASPRPSKAEWLFALLKFALGLAVLYGIVPLLRGNDAYLVGWVGMVGIVLLLHFGSFHLLSCAWRTAGVMAKPVMNWPLLSTSLGDFWGRRWNTAFRDLTHRFLFRPLTPRLGPRGAVFAGFVFSGVVHDVVISWPAEGGYGGPTAYFIIQGAGILVERSRVARAIGLGKGWRGWFAAMILLVGPAWALFHPPFVLRVVVPFLHYLGAV